MSDQNTNEAETKDKLLRFMCVGREDHMTPIHSSAHYGISIPVLATYNECMHLQTQTNCSSDFLLQVLHLIYFYTVIHMFYVAKLVHI